MGERLAVIILDALDPYNMRQLGLERIQDLYRERHADVLGISTLPHTAASNPMIWGGYRNEDRFWVKDDTSQWTDPAREFDRDTEETAPGTRHWRREDIEEAFIWDVLAHHGLEATALQIPIVLPPYSFNATDTVEEAWFPHRPPLMQKHIREKPELIMEHADAGREFIGSSIQMPDKWLHGMGEGKCDQAFVDEEAPVLDRKVADMVERLEAEGYDWMLFGDHGSPWPGSMPVRATRQVLPRHRKESIIISSLPDPPRYTHEIYPFFLDYFGVDDVPFTAIDPPETSPASDDEAVMERLGALGYLNE